MTLNAVENMNSSLLNIRNLHIFYLINGVIEKLQAKYLCGYLKCKMIITDHAFNFYKYLSKIAVTHKVFSTQERDTYSYLW